MLHIIALISIVVGLLCAIAIAIDERSHPQSMAVMNWVWPLTALFGGLLWLWLYFRWGRQRDGADRQAKPPFPVMVAKASSHCGAGCTLGDLIAESLAFAVPAIAVAFGWGSLFQDKMFAVWVLDFLLAFMLGIGFQYFTIAPMRSLSVKEGLRQALQADVASISAWQIGMYGFMALAQLVWFPAVIGGRAEVNTPEFWFAMQLAMLCGFVTSYPVNWVLLRLGVKEKM